MASGYDTGRHGARILGPWNLPKASSLEEESLDYQQERPIPWDLPFPGTHTPLSPFFTPPSEGSVRGGLKVSLRSQHTESGTADSRKTSAGECTHLSPPHSQHSSSQLLQLFLRYSRAFLYGDPLHPRPFLKLQEFDSCLELRPENSS